MSEILISAVQERPVLWDKRNTKYHNRLLSYREWEELAKIIGTTSDAAKKKWKNLRDSYAKELKKIPKPRSGADAENEPEYTGSWPYFESMSFLKVILNPRKTHGNFTEDSTENTSTEYSQSTYASPTAPATPQSTVDVNDDETQIQESESVMPPILPARETRRDDNISSASTTPTAVIRQKRKRKDDGLEAFLELEREKMKVLCQDQEDKNDDDLLWFKSILPYMKQLPSLNKLHFRTQMQEFLLTELSKLNTPQVPRPNPQHAYFTNNFEL